MVRVSRVAAPPLQQRVGRFGVAMMLEASVDEATNRDGRHRITQKITDKTHATGQWQLDEHGDVWNVTGQ